jgi:hypothetical protein
LHNKTPKKLKKKCEKLMVQKYAGSDEENNPLGVNAAFLGVNVYRLK